MADEKQKKKVAAVIAGPIARLEAAAKRARPIWPPKGGTYEGMKPGDWKSEVDRLDDTGHLPEDCPVRPLGYEEESFYFVDTRGQVFNTAGKAIGVERMQILFAGHEEFLYWAWPSFSKEKAVTGFKAEEARRDLFAACTQRGPWNMTDMVRGRGAWTDDRGRLVIHCGEDLFIDGRLEDTGELDDHFYVRRPKTFTPWSKPVERDDNPAVEIFEMLRTWHFVRGDIDVMLQVGWLAVAMMGAALDWRPSIFIVGDAGMGKSELHKLFKTILGRGMISTTNATEAGLYQIVGHDSLPICIDEIEGEDGQEQAAKIIKMARDAASGSVRIRGGADHKGVEFQAKSTFLFSAINPPPLPPASLTRLAVLQLRELKDTSGRVPELKDPETVGPKLLRRIADGWEDWPRLYEQYREALRAHGHNARGQNTFGTFLAGAHLLLGDEGMDDLGLPFEDLDHWGQALAAENLAELAGKQPNWSKCLETIMTAQVDGWSKGERYTIGAALEPLLNRKKTDTFAPEDVEAAVRAKLLGADIGLVPWGLCGADYGLAIPHSSRILGKLLTDTSWGGKGGEGSWSWALQQAPDTVRHQKIALKHGRLDNRMSINGQQRRCSFISLADWRAYQGEGEEE